MPVSIHTTYKSLLLFIEFGRVFLEALIKFPQNLHIKTNKSSFSPPNY